MVFVLVTWLCIEVGRGGVLLSTIEHTKNSTVSSMWVFNSSSIQIFVKIKGGKWAPNAATGGLMQVIYFENGVFGLVSGIKRFCRQHRHVDCKQYAAIKRIRRLRNVYLVMCT